MTIQDYNLDAAVLVLVLAVVALIAERHSRSGSRYLLIIIVLAALVNLGSSTATYLEPEGMTAVRFVNAALRTMALILLLGWILHRPRLVR